MISEKAQPERRRRITTHVSPHREQGDYHRQTSGQRYFTGNQFYSRRRRGSACCIGKPHFLLPFRRASCTVGQYGTFLGGTDSTPCHGQEGNPCADDIFGKVHFRVSPGFRKQCAGFVERVRAGYGFRHSEDIGGAERYRRLCAFLDANPFITRKDYSGITGLLKNKALNDLNLLVEKGILTTLGQGSHKVYVRAVNQSIAE